MTRISLFSTALVILLFAWSCQMPKNQVLVLNIETSPASFGLSCDDRQTWKPETLGSKARQRFECDTPGAKMWLHLNTDIAGTPHQESEIQLSRGQRYEIYFDQTGRKWNVRPAI